MIQGFSQKKRLIDYPKVVAPFEKELASNSISVSELLEKVNNEIKISDRTKDSARLIYLFTYKTRLIQSFLKSGNAKDSGKKILLLSNSISDPYLKTEGLIGYSYYLRNLGKIDSSLYQLHRAKEIAVNRFPELQKEIDFEIIGNLMVKGNYQEAIVLIDTFLSQSSNLSDSLNYLFLKGTALESMGKPDKALELLLQAQQKFTEENDERKLINIYFQIGELLKNLSLHQKALHYYNLIEDKSSHYKQKSLIVRLHKNLGELYLKTEAYDKAKYHLELGLKTIENSETYPFGHIQINLAHLYSVTGQYEMAETHIKEASNFFQQNDFKRGLLLVDIERARLAFTKEELVTAETILKKTIEQLRLLDIPLYEISATNLLISVLQSKGDYKDAFLQQRRNDQLKERTIGSRQALVNVTKLLHDFENQEKTYASNWIYYIIPFLLLLLFVVGFRKTLFKRSGVENPTKYLSDVEEIEQLKDSLMFQLVTQKAYLNKNLSLKLLAESTGTTDKKLSYMINSEMSTTFYDLLNVYRLEEFESLVSQNKQEDYSLQGLIEMSGFSSKTVFYRVFKEKYGMTPSNYLKSLD